VESERTEQYLDCLPGSNEELKTAGIFIGGLGDAGEMLDEQAKVAYRPPARTYSRPIR
jgi:hypothetical protein